MNEPNFERLETNEPAKSTKRTVLSQSPSKINPLEIDDDFIAEVTAIIPPICITK